MNILSRIDLFELVHVWSENPALNRLTRSVDFVNLSNAAQNHQNSHLHTQEYPNLGLLSFMREDNRMVRVPMVRYIHPNEGRGGID